MGFRLSCYFRAVWYLRYGNSNLLLVLRPCLSTLGCLLVLWVLPECLLSVALPRSGLSNRPNRRMSFAQLVRPACSDRCRLLLLKNLLPVFVRQGAYLRISCQSACDVHILWFLEIDFWFNFFDLFGNERRCCFVSLPFSMLLIFIPDIFFIRVKSRSMRCFVSRA